MEDFFPNYPYRLESTALDGGLPFVRHLRGFRRLIRPDCLFLAQVNQFGHCASSGYSRYIRAEWIKTRRKMASVYKQMGPGGWRINRPYYITILRNHSRNMEPFGSSTRRFIKSSHPIIPSLRFILVMLPGSRCQARRAPMWRYCAVRLAPSLCFCASRYYCLQSERKYMDPIMSPSERNASRRTSIQTTPPVPNLGQIYEVSHVFTAVALSFFVHARTQFSHFHS